MSNNTSYQELPSNEVQWMLILMLGTFQFLRCAGKWFSVLVGKGCFAGPRP